VLVEMRKAKRPGKVFVDWSQNNRSKTTIGVYSLRARPRPTASTPITWDEVSDAVDSGDRSALVFESAEVLERLAEQSDLSADVQTMQQDRPAPQG
jgi:bifunctional non-homologous end joining protein LigD